MDPEKTQKVLEEVYEIIPDDALESDKESNWEIPDKPECDLSSEY